MTRKLQELIEEIKEIDCPHSHCGDECCWTGYEFDKTSLVQEVIKKVAKIAQLAEEEGIRKVKSHCEQVLKAEKGASPYNRNMHVRAHYGKVVDYCDQLLSNQKEDA